MDDQMSLDPGKLRHRVTLQSQQQTQDTTTGEITTTWATVATVWAAVEPLSVKEFLSEGALQNEVSARITLRFRADLRPTWRIVHGSKVYAIQGALPDPDSGIEWMTLAVSEGVNEGG